MKLGVHPMWMGGWKSGPSLPMPTTWVARSTPTSNALAAIASDGLNVVAVGATQTVIRSSDGGDNWSTSSGGFTSGGVNDVFWGGGNFIALGAGTSTSNKIRYSINGASFASASHPYSSIANMYGGAYGASNFIVVPLADTPRCVRSSTASGPFSASMTPQTHATICVGTDGLGNVVVGGMSGEISISSDDGNTFSSVVSPATGQISKVRHGNGKFLIVGQGGLNYQSDNNGASWTSANISTSEFLFDAHYHGGVWVVVGNNGLIRYSIDDMATWHVSTISLGGSINGVTFTNNRWIIAGDSGSIYTSQAAS